MMGLIRVGASGAEKLAAPEGEDRYVELSDVVDDIGEAFFASGGLDRVRPIAAERTAAGQTHDLRGLRLDPPIARPHQIICVGLNYSDHASETGQAVPTEPILFTKSPNTLVGPFDHVRILRGATKTDWEVELGIVIGSRASYLDTLDDARDAIAGWVIVNDVSERAFQLERGGQWLKGKSAETSTPPDPGWPRATRSPTSPASA